MRILFINTYDTKGGAAKAAYRLFNGVKENNVQARYWVKHKSLAEEDIIVEHLNIGARAINKLLKGIGNRVIRKIRGTNKTYWNYNIIPRYSQYKKLSRDSDMIHLHWIAEDFIPIKMLAKFKKPIIWTLHDSWAFTGGCHIPMSCKEYMIDCSKCPQAKSKGLAKFILKKKIETYEKLDLIIVTPSRWLAECVRQSKALQNKSVYTIPNGIDTSLFRPMDKKVIREKLGLEQHKKYILFGAMGSTSDPNKGFHLLAEALSILTLKNVEIIIFGSTKSELDKEIAYKIHYMGEIYEEIKMAEIYSAADVFVAPSLSENLPYTIMEAMACGVPAVAFNIGGVPDLITHQINGYLAKPYEPKDLANGIEWGLQGEDSVGISAREHIVSEFDINKVTKGYIELYKQVYEK